MNMSEPEQFIAEGLRGKMRRNVPMCKHTSWRAGGTVQCMYQPAGLDDLLAFLRGLPADEPLVAVGLGSNLLVRDGGVPGAKLARFAALHNLHGAEFFAGIPGTVGGMLAMNAGCYGSEIWQKVLRVLVVDRSGALHERTPSDYEIGYRHIAKKSRSEGRREKGGEAATCR